MVSPVTLCLVAAYEYTDTDLAIVRGTLPLQLLVETLHSLQAIMFPPTDSKSAHILEQLIKKKGFDPVLAEYDGYSVFLEPPEGFRYRYWGDRISSLHDQLEQRPPRNKLERWFNWQANDGNALLVALFALLITIVTGVITIIISALQTWVAWQAWKYPISAQA